jgi:ABC-type spermidine/putrescine transport system permease subunit I
VTDAAPAESAAATRTRLRESTDGRVRGLLLALPPILFVVIFIGLPIVNAALYSLGHFGGLNSTTAAIGTHQFKATAWWGTLGAYRDVFSQPRFWSDLSITVVVTVISTVVVLIMATGIALFLRLQGSVLSKGLAALSVVPRFIPVVISSWAILSFYSATGLPRTIAAHLGFNFPIWGFTSVAVVIGSVWTSMPFAVLMIASGVQAVPDALIEAARDAGASLARTVWTVVLPMAFVPIVIATTFTAIDVIGSFTVPYLTGPTAPSMLGVSLTRFFQAYNQPQQSVVMAFVIFIVAALIGAAYVWANFRSSREVS